MATLYLNRDALGVRLEGEHLVVTDHSAVRAGEAGGVKVPLGDVERVVVLGEPAITFPVLSWLLAHAIPCVFLSHGGRWRGELSCGLDLHGERRLLQYARTASEPFQAHAAAQLVAAKAENGRRVLRRLRGNRGFRPVAPSSGRGALPGRMGHCRSLERIRGVEGLLARRHFAALRDFFPAEMGFLRRERHPPKDPANALLSFTYALLLGEMVSAIRRHGLDPAIGCLHATDGRRPSLALDLMEPFRPICGDLLAVSLCSHRILSAERHFSRTATGAVHLNDEGRHRVLKAYAERLEQRFRDPMLGSTTTLRETLERTVTLWIQGLESGIVPTLFRLP